MRSSLCSSCVSGDSDCVHRRMMETYPEDETDLYFEDEELDRYRGRRSCEYTDDEAGEFREVMITMRPDEVGEWCRCLQLRCLEVPDQIKDELTLLLQ